jgi:hypothetical protein
MQQVKHIDELGFIDRKTVESVIEANRQLMLKQTALDLLKKELYDGVVAVLDSYVAAVDNHIRDILPISVDSLESSEKLF